MADQGRRRLRALNNLARGNLDLGKVRKWWPDILRLIGSIYTGQVNVAADPPGCCPATGSAYGTPTPWW